MGRPPKKKIFKYFDSRDDILPKQAVKEASVKFNTSGCTVRKYYREWRRQYVRVRI